MSERKYEVATGSGMVSYLCASFLTISEMHLKDTVSDSFISIYSSI